MDRSDSPQARQQTLLRRTRASLERRRAAQEDLERLDPAPQPGDLYVFPESADFDLPDFDLQWMVLEREPDGKTCTLLAVDLHPVLGNSDVAIPADAPCGALSVRGEYEVRVETSRCRLRTGRVPEETLALVQDHRASPRDRDDEGSVELHDLRERTLFPAVALLSGAPIQFAIRVWGEDADIERIDRDTRLLLAELADLDLEWFRPQASGSIPAGARSGGAVVPGRIEVSARPEALKSLLDLLRSWSSRSTTRSAEILSPEDDEQTLEDSPTVADLLRGLLRHRNRR